jgi:DNA polymerase-3 subunit epsilon
MRLRTLLPLLLAGVAFASYLAMIGPLAGLTAIEGLPPQATERARLALTIGLGATLSSLVGAWAFLHLRLVKPTETLGFEAKTLARTLHDRPLEVPAAGLIEPLPAAVNALAERLRAARAETGAVVAEATRRAEEQKSRLEAILLDLSEGVIVCNLEHRILLYNQSAARILDMAAALGLGRSLFGLITSEPVLHVLEQLIEAQRAPSRTEEAAGEHSIRRFVCATIDLATLLEARLSLIREAQGEVSGYVLTLTDVGTQVENVASRDVILREVMVDWRRPLANLTAASETLAVEPDLAGAERKAFEDIIAKEIASLNERFVAMSARYEQLTAGPWPMSDVHSLDLFRAVAKHVADREQIELTLIGVPAWLHADSHSLMLALEHLIGRLAAQTGLKRFEIQAIPGDRYTYIDIVWDGQPLPSATLEGWLDEPLAGTIASRTVRIIVEQHGSEVWSRPLSDGRASMRVPLKPALRPMRVQVARSAPRPEFYDFDLFGVSDTKLADTPLRQIRFVVFDTETTGLKPSEGDKLLSIGAVRVVNGRILTGETFERLINPGRGIPSASIAIHGISEEMVRDKPPARIVLPQFRAFCRDCVLVAYNAAFDMRFLELAEEETGVRFDLPVLDALLLSIYLHKDAADHSLSGMAAMLGIEIAGRHTALGDAMMTAAVWVRILELLQEQGIRTFGEAVKISSRMMEERRAILNF